jgi:hypothetical protein
MDEAQTTQEQIQQLTDMVMYNQDKLNDLIWWCGVACILMGVIFILCMLFTYRAFTYEPESEGYYGFPSRKAYEEYYDDPQNLAFEIPAMEAYSREAEQERARNADYPIRLRDTV